jgi:hypothetical protein
MTDEQWEKICEETRIAHNHELRLWHTRQGKYADPRLPPPTLKLPERPK